jgi:asparagine synthetase B (glutamine-hydrolysing)
MENIDFLEKSIIAEVDKLRDEIGEINLFISGGIDSGLLAALSNPDKLYTVRIPFDSRFNEFEDTLKTVKHLGLENRLTVIDIDVSRFDEVMKEAVKAIGRSIPHFNIFPFYLACEKVFLDGVKHIVVGDGPDESMCGYTRHIIMNHLYKSYRMEAFDNYHGIIDKLLDPFDASYARLINKDPNKVTSIFERTAISGGNILDCMCAVDMQLMRLDMDDMTNSIAKHFDIKIHRPYQDSFYMDQLMFSLPEDQKINGEYGKWLLRLIAMKHLPTDIALRKQKIGGPLVPVNQIKGWGLDPFDKKEYLKYQEEILNG